MKRIALFLLLVFMFLPYIAAADNPVENLSKAGIAGNMTNFTAKSFEWSLETGYYTRWWANFSRPIPDVYGFFYGTFLPVSSKMGWGWMLFMMWGGIVTTYFLATQDTTLPFIIAILGGGLLSWAMGSEQVILMILVVIFLGAGPLIKFIMGPDR